MKKILIFVLLCYNATTKIIAQIPRSNFSIFLYKGISKSNATIKNPFWLQENKSLVTGYGDAYGLEVNQRVFKNLWLGFGTQINHRIYTFDRVDPYNKSVNVESFVRKDLGQDFSLKAEYFYLYKKLKFSGLVRYKTQIWLNSRSTIRQNNLISTKNESYFLASGYRQRLEFGVSASWTFGKQQRWALRLEPTYSYYTDVKKSPIVDKMNIKSLTFNFGIIRYFRPILF